MCDPLRTFATVSGAAFRDDPAATRAALRPQVDQPVGFGDDIEVVLDDDDRVAGIDEPMQHAQQLLDVRHVQADRGLVEHVQGVPISRLGRGSLPGVVLARQPQLHRPQPRQFGDELDALRFAAGQRRARLPERQVTEPHVLQQRQRVVDLRMRGEELGRLVHAHGQHLADVAAAMRDGQRLRVEALAAARVARAP